MQLSDQFRRRSAMTEAIKAQIRARVKALEDYVNGLTGCTRCLRALAVYRHRQDGPSSSSSRRAGQGVDD